MRALPRFLTGIALACLAMLSAAPPSARAAAPEPSSITPELIEAAKKEGRVVFYTSIDLQTAENIGKAFEKAFPGVTAQIERSGAERIFQRLSQERGSQIYAADVLEASDMTAFVAWKKEGWLIPYVPEIVAKAWPADERDPDGLYASVRLSLSPLAYNTKLVKAEDAPKSFADVLDPKWKGKIVKAHPGYSGTIMTTTFELVREFGWDYMKKLGQQRVLQVQSAADPPKKLAAGERAIEFDGGEYVLLQLRAQGSPVEVVYPTEGTPSAPGGAGLIKDAPHPNAARLFLSYLFSQEGQQVFNDVAWLRSFHPGVKLHPGIKPLSEIKLLKADPAAQEKMLEEIKEKYASFFGL